MIGYAYDSTEDLVQEIARRAASNVTSDTWERELEYIRAELNRRGVTKDNIMDLYPEYFI